MWVNNTVEDKRLIRARHLYKVFTWIDATYNKRRHTYWSITIGYGIIHRKSPKQNTNVKSSTEAELVGTGDYIPYNMLFMMLSKEQGYEIK